MRALVWNGINELAVEHVDEPRIVNPHDAIVKVSCSTTCGSDLHLINGYIPTMSPGDVIGHEFMGEVVETGPAVERVRAGQRVVVPSFISCGACGYCRRGLWSLDSDCFPVPDGVSDEQALFCSDAAPTGYMGADFCNLSGGETVAVWGCGGVGLMAQRGALLMGAERVIAIDTIPERLRLAERFGAEPLDYRNVGSVSEALIEMTGGRGPDACIDAVGMEADGTGVDYAYDRVKQALRMHSDRGQALRQAVISCRKGGVLSVLGVYGVVDKFPMGVIMNKGLTVRTAQQHGQAYVERLLAHVERGELDTGALATNTMPLEQAVEGYAMFKEKRDGCIRAVFVP